METYKTRYQLLNSEQRAAVDQIDGPMLVIAGPGTGKTELLSVRVAHILTQTDTLPSNILCLTFTEAAAFNMRDRLQSIIGDDAYSVQINTYHSFSSDIIKSNPDFFGNIDLETGEDSRMEHPINELRQYEIIREIIESLPFSDPLRSMRYYVRSIVSTISDCKQAALSPEQVQKIGKENLQTTEELSPAIQQIMSAYKRLPSKLSTSLELFNKVLATLEQSSLPLAKQAAAKLVAAIEAAEATESTKPMTAWKNSWLEKDTNDSWQFGNKLQSQKVISLANIYAKYQEILQDSGQYDFNDMILRTIEAMKERSELRYNLQEKYHYILLDEFQDTNTAQFSLITLLADHPVNEGRPNIMAVGDDDQGIFAFQGADVANMMAFLNTFVDVRVINLTKNYRSHHDILHIAHNLGEQIESRLHHNLKDISKTIQAASDGLPAQATIARHEFGSQANEYGWIADTISQQIATGIPPREIAVLAPRHSILENLVPFLNARNIPVSYEKRENIFDTEIIQALLLMSEFLVAADTLHIETMNTLLPKILSLPFWGIPAEDIWQLNWKFYSEKFKTQITWEQLALTQPSTKKPVKFLLHIGLQVDSLSLEFVLDYLIGAKPYHLDNNSTYTSPLKEYYFSDAAQKKSPLAFHEAISYLSVIRAQIRDLRLSDANTLRIHDFIDLYKTYLEAEQPLINTHPVTQNNNAVQLQTVYKAKGLEYQCVFLPCMQDDVWGSTSRGSNNKLSLPENLQHIRYDASQEDTRRRLLFVAVTRAKHSLYITSYLQKENGKPTTPVKYLHEINNENEKLSTILPKSVQVIGKPQRDETTTQKDIETLWFARNESSTTNLVDQLQSHLRSYRMSPTHLNTFTNLEYAGPQVFLLHTLLRFPEAPSPDSIYGDALHKTLEWFQTKKTSSITGAVEQFQSRIHTSIMNTTDKQLYTDRGARALQLFLTKNSDRLKVKTAEIEVDFRKEGVVLGNALLTGKIDRLEVNQKNKCVKIIDFKSGAPSTKWSSTSKYINYKQQLYFYYLLIEKSPTFKGYQVENAALEFIEPLSDNSLTKPLELKFDTAEYEQFKQLITVVWDRIQKLNLPDVGNYQKTSSGIRMFIKDLLT